MSVLLGLSHGRSRSISELRNRHAIAATRELTRDLPPFHASTSPSETSLIRLRPKLKPLGGLSAKAMPLDRRRVNRGVRFPRPPTDEARSMINAATNSACRLGI